ncbi:MAG: hypothetical protein Q9192_001443 [Flavoplaca navasiana]
MGYDDELYSFSSHTSAIKHRLHSPNVALRTSSGNGQNPVTRRRAAAFKTEDNDDAWSFECRSGGSIHSHSAQAAIKQQLKKRRRIERKAKEDEDDGEEDEETTKWQNTWQGLDMAELQSPKYLTYRERQRQRARDRPNETKVWDDELENAFQLAIRIVPPVGRKKEQRRGKLCGRNERISHLIKRWTGKERTRKQISSHIQVLRAFMFNNEQWLQHVTANKTSSVGMSAPQSHLRNLDLENLNDDDFRALVRDPFSNIGARKPTGPLLYPPPNTILGSNAPDQKLRLNRIAFEMFVVSPASERIHTYTSNQAEIGASPQALEEICNWRTSFPRLEDYHRRGELEDNIILIESNIDLPINHPPRNSTLSIDFQVNIAGASGSEQWSTNTDYYENNGEPVDMRRFYEMNKIRRASPWDTPTVSHRSGSGDMQLKISLHSTWWVQVFTNMAARKNGMMHDPYFMRQEEDWSRRYLQDMSIMQELCVDSAGTGASARRVAIILWKFSPVRQGEVATTSWRRLRAPPQRFKMDSPILSPEPLLQRAMGLDSSLQHIAMPQPIVACAGRFLHNQSDIFAEDSERIVSESQSVQDSPVPALSPDYTTSFPSSTTTSFPPSVTYGYPSHDESQESACYSQDGHSYGHESFASQTSFNFPQKSGFSVEEARVFEQELNHFPGNLELESQDPAYYSQQSLGPIPDFHSPLKYDEELCQDGSHYPGPHTTNDSSGGQNQLSFQTDQVAPELHSASYIDHSRGIARFEESVQTESQSSYHEFHAAIKEFSGQHAETNGITAGIQQNDDLDFSAWDAHFTPEDLAALRAHSGGFDIHSDVQHIQSETHHLDPPESQVHTESDWTIIQMKNHSQATIQEQIDPGALAGEKDDYHLLLEESHEGDDNAGDSFGFKEIHGPESQLVESQAVEGQHEQHITGGLEHDYEDHDLHEDHL